MNYRILVINPGSTSTKMGVFDGENCVFQETLRHSADELAPFSHVMEQVDFRRALVEKVLEEKHIAPETLNAVCARGGQIPPCPSGAFVVDKQMCDYLYGVKEAAHASNLGAVIALHIAETQGIPAYVYDPVAVDEMTPMTRITGMPCYSAGCWAIPSTAGPWPSAARKRSCTSRWRNAGSSCCIWAAALRRGCSSAAKWWTVCGTTRSCSPRSAAAARIARA